MALAFLLNRKMLEREGHSEPMVHAELFYTLPLTEKVAAAPQQLFSPQTFESPA